MVLPGHAEFQVNEFLFLARQYAYGVFCFKLGFLQYPYVYLPKAVLKALLVVKVVSTQIFLYIRRKQHCQ